MSNWCHTSISFKCTGRDFKDIAYKTILLPQNGTEQIGSLSIDKLNQAGICKRTDFQLDNGRDRYICVWDTWRKDYEEIDIKAGDNCIWDLIVDVNNGIINQIYYYDEDSNKQIINDDQEYEFDIYYNTKDYYPSWLVPIAFAALVDVDFSFYHNADTEIGGNIWYIKNKNLYSRGIYEEIDVVNENNELIEIGFDQVKEEIIEDGWDYWVKKGYIRGE